MDKRSAWDEPAEALKRKVCERDGFLTMQRDELRKRFGIGRLTKRTSENLTEKLKDHGMLVYPHPDWLYTRGENSLRVYDNESEIGKIAQAIVCPQNVPETALRDAVDLHKRADAGKDLKSVDVPWLKALEVFLQCVIGRPPEDWEDLKDDRPPYELVDDLAKSLGLTEIGPDNEETRRIAGAVCTCRPRARRLDCASPDLNAAITEAAGKQKKIFDRVLREAAKHLLGGAEIPSRDVELGRLGLRYRNETQGGIG